MPNRLVPKFRRDILVVRSPSPISGPPAQGSSARKTSPHNFWLQKPVGIKVSGRNCWSPKQFLLKEPTHGLTYSDSLPLSFSTRT